MNLLYSSAVEGIGSLDATTNPFESVYAIVFRLTVHTLATSRVASNPTLCADVRRIFNALDQCGSPFTIMFPWFLGRERIQRFYLMKRFHNIISAAGSDRREDRNDEDPMQYLIDVGLSSLEITQVSVRHRSAFQINLYLTQFTLAALFAGIANTGIVAAFILCDLATHPDALAQVREEVLGFVSSFGGDESLPLSARIQSITYENWITTANLPILDRCLKETIRLRLITPLQRLNDSGRDIEIGGMLVPKDAILTFHTAFIHHNSDIYTDPLTWDPERFSNERVEGKSVPLSYCGWGLGKHLCCGQNVRETRDPSESCC